MFFEQKKETKLYDILNVSKDSSDNDIKKSYKKLAMKYHPDRNKEIGSEEKFKEISRAYSILGNKEKRETYDTFGEEGLNNNASAQMPNMDPFGMFSNLFNMNGSGGHRQKTKTQDRMEEIEVSLEDIYKEKTMKLNYDKKIICNTCSGLGVKDRKKTKRCSTCKGSGKIIRIVQLGPGFISQQQSQCNVCNGSGKINEDDNICEECSGEKTIGSRNNIKIHLRKKFKDGHTLKYSGEADQHPEADIYGDLLVKLNIKRHSTFKIYKHRHLIIDKKITLIEALCGCTFKIVHLDGRTLFIDHNEVIQPFSKKIIKGEGLGGDLIIHFVITFPEYIDEERKQYIRELFQKYGKLDKIEPEDNFIVSTLEEFNDSYENKGAEKEEKEEENVECVQQ